MRAKPFTSGFLGRLRPRSLGLRLHRDQRGHVAIMYAVCMLFVSALVFFVIAAGKRYIQKETIQAAVDAASFAAAAAEAKTMNTIAFCNLVLAIGIAIVYTLQGIGIAIGVYVTGVLAAEATLVGCIPIIDDCVFVDTGVPEALAIRYGEASEDLANRLKPIAHAAEELAKVGPTLMLVEAEEVSMHEAYSKRLPGMVVITDPLVPKLPVKDGMPNQICGPSPEKEENGVELGVQGLGLLPMYIPPDGKGLIAAAFLISDAASAAGVCGGQYAFLKPQVLDDLWERDAPVKAVAFLSDAKPDDRRAYLVAAASQWGPARNFDSKWLLATSEASVYGFDGKRGEDLWHMDWRARLVLSQAKDFGPLRVLASGPIGAILKSVWVH
jgi:hypothetical protein